MGKLSFVLSNWKLVIHHLFKTRHFGVDNQLYSPFPSIWGLSFFPFLLQFILIYPIIINYRAMKVRVGPSVAFIAKSQYSRIFSK